MVLRNREGSSGQNNSSGAAISIKMVNAVRSCVTANPVSSPFCQTKVIHRVIMNLADARTRRTPNSETNSCEADVRERANISHTDVSGLAAVRCNRSPETRNRMLGEGRAGASKTIHKNPTQATMNFSSHMVCRGPRNEKQIIGRRSCGGDGLREHIL